MSQASTGEEAADDGTARLEAEVKELQQRAERRIAMLGTDPTACSTPEAYAELREMNEFLEVEQFLEVHGVDFVNQMLQMQAVLCISGEPDVVNAIRNRLPGTLDRTTLAAQSAQAQRKAAQLTEAVLQAYSAVQRLCGGDPDKISLKNRNEVFRPILELHRETCTKCMRSWEERNDESEDEDEAEGETGQSGGEEGSGSDALPAVDE